MAAVELGRNYCEARREVLDAINSRLYGAECSDSLDIPGANNSLNTRCYLGNHPRGSAPVKVLIVKDRGCPKEVRSVAIVCRSCFGEGDFHPEEVKENLTFLLNSTPNLAGALA